MQIDWSFKNEWENAFALISFQDIIRAIVGISNKTILDTIETYYLAENKWTTIDTKLLSNRCNHSAVVHNKKFFVVGGDSPYGTLSSVEVYSSKTNQFSFVTSMNLSRANFGCCILNSSLYVIGGVLDWNNNIITDEVEIYDIQKDVWEKGLILPSKLTSVGCSSNEI